MIELVAISLENEMDLVLANRRTMKVAEKLGLTVSTQTTFSTAVSEIARTVIEHTDNGSLVIGLEQAKQRYGLKAVFTFESEVRFTNADEGYYYAQKLVPEFDMHESGGITVITMKIGLPRSLHLDKVKTNHLQAYFAKEEPLNAYEEIKKRNVSLNRIAEEQEEELRQSRIIDEKKTEFMSIASHEIKTPITIIKAYSQMAKARKDECSDQVKGILDKIDLQSTKLLTLVQQLLDVSKIENGNLAYTMERVDFNLFVSAMVTLMRSIMPHHELTMNLTGKGTVDLDTLRMEQVFSNLFGNAAKYSEKNTNISIHTECCDDDHFKVTISDRGIGMSEDSIKSIFNKFYRADDVLRTHAGLGMGLYVSSKIITDHGGRIWVDSEVGTGSSFCFTLPLSIREPSDLN
jgi:signal transduction histidine kinase